MTRLLEEHFPRLVDYDFTASMEEDLDQIANGDEQRVEWLERFYFGDEATSAEGLSTSSTTSARSTPARSRRSSSATAWSCASVATGPTSRRSPPPASTRDRRGDLDEAPAVPETPRRATINDDIAPDEMTPAKARELLDAAADDGRVLGLDPLSGNEIIAKAGRYGPYVTEVLPETEDEAPKRGKAAAKVKPRTASLFKDMDLATIDLDAALQLLSLPRVVGTVTEDDGTSVDITAQNGRYGPYLKKGTDSRSLVTEQQLFDITLDEALAIYAQPKQRGRAAAAPLKELGTDPVSGKAVTVKDGRFGAYVTDGETNATLRRDDDPESITAERGYELLAEKRAKGPTTRKRAAKKTTKSTAKKTTAKKTAAARTTGRAATRKA